MAIPTFMARVASKIRNSEEALGMITKNRAVIGIPISKNGIRRPNLESVLSLTDAKYGWRVIAATLSIVMMRPMMRFTGRCSGINLS